MKKNKIETGEMHMKVQRQKTKRQIERGKKTNNNQYNHQQNRYNYILTKYLFYYIICTSVFVSGQSILKQDHATGREAALAGVSCYHSTEQQNILSDGGKKG